MNKIKIVTTAFLLISGLFSATAQQLNEEDSVPQSYFITAGKAQYLQKLAALPCGVKETDDLYTITNKIEKFLKAYQPQEKYPDDLYAKASSLQALKSIQEGGYGIGAVLIDSNGIILEEAHNNQIQLHRSDLHGEMSLLSQFEQKEYASRYMNSYVYKRGLTVFSSAEPCPMCFMRLAIAGVDTKYCTPGPDDGMVNRVNCLPSAWVGLAAKHHFTKANTSPVMQKMAHLLFFSFLLDNRGPK